MTQSDTGGRQGVWGTGCRRKDRKKGGFIDLYNVPPSGCRHGKGKACFVTHSVCHTYPDHWHAGAAAMCCCCDALGTLLVRLQPTAAAPGSCAGSIAVLSGGFWLPTGPHICCLLCPSLHVVCGVRPAGAGTTWHQPAAAATRPASLPAWQQQALAAGGVLLCVCGLASNCRA